LQALFSAIFRATFSAPDAYYGTFGYGAFGGSAIGYPLAYSHGYAATAYVPATYAAPVIAEAAPVIAKVHSEVDAKVPSVTSSQFHSQDEEGNYAFGYNNINSARQESGNARTGVSGSYSDGFRTYNYVADDWGFRHV
jgi:hypothetical protein